MLQIKAVKLHLFRCLQGLPRYVEMNDGLRDRAYISMVKVPTMRYAAPEHTDHPLLLAVIREKT